MPTFYRPLAVLHSGSAASSPGRLATAPDFTLPIVVPVPVALDPITVGVLLGRLFMFGPHIELVAVEFEPVGSGSAAGDPAILRAAVGDVEWTVTTFAGATTRVANTVPCIVQRTPEVVGPLVAMTPVSGIQISGAALALFGITPPTSLECRLILSARNRFAPSSAQVGSFRDSATDPDGRVQLHTMLQTLRQRGGAQFPTQANAGQAGGPTFPAITVAQNYAAIDALFAGASPFGAVWCNAGDVGVSTPLQVKIPTELVANNVASFERYPATFFRRPTFARAVVHASDEEQGDPNGINGFTGTPTIYTAIADMVCSQWLVQVDGVNFEVLLRHDTIAGLRRPIDVWNRVIVNAIARGETSVLDLVEFLPPPVPPGGGTRLIGELSRLEFLEYATFLGGFSDLTGETSSFVPYAQVGSMPAPPPG